MCTSSVEVWLWFSVRPDINWCSFGTVQVVISISSMLACWSAVDPDRPRLDLRRERKFMTILQLLLNLRERPPLCWKAQWQAAFIAHQSNFISRSHKHFSLFHSFPFSVTLHAVWKRRHPCCFADDLYLLRSSIWRCQSWYSSVS
jgi:hypothetical protein